MRQSLALAAWPSPLALRRILGVRRIPHFRHHAQAVRTVGGQGLRVEAMVGLELAQPQRDAAILDRVAKRSQRAVFAHVFAGGVRVHLFQLAGDKGQQGVLRGLRVEFGELVPCLGLGVLDVADDVLWIERPHPVVLVRRAQQPAVGRQVGDDFILEGAFSGGVGHGAGVLLSEAAGQCT